MSGGRGGGRGRGRGRGGSSGINVLSEALGIGRQDVIGLSSPAQPPELFPPLERKPSQLVDNQYYNYLIALKQEFRNYMRDSPYYVRPETERSKIERYSDKFKHYNSHKELDWVPKWSMYPEELRMKSVAKETEVKPRMIGKRQNLLDAKNPAGDPMKKLNKLVTKGDKEGDEEASDEEALPYEEEDEEDEDLDYVQNYYDDEDGAFDDDVDEGPCF